MHRETYERDIAEDIVEDRQFVFRFWANKQLPQKLIWLKKIFREIKEKSADKKCGQVQNMVSFVCSFSLAFIWPDNFFP